MGATLLLSQVGSAEVWGAVKRATSPPWPLVASVPTNLAQGGERTSKELIAQPVLEPPCMGEPVVVLLDAVCSFTSVCITLSAIGAARGSG